MPSSPTAGYRRDDVMASIGTIFLSVADLDMALDGHIKRTLDNQLFMSWFSADEIKFQFTEKDREPQTLLTRKLKHFVKLVRKIDHKRRYIELLQPVHHDLVQAITIRNCMAHNRTYFFPPIGLVREIRLSKRYEVKREAGYPVYDQIDFSLDASELFAIDGLIRSASTWMFVCAVEIMYDYGLAERVEQRLFQPFPPDLWPHRFHRPPYPWQEDHPMHGIEARGS